MKIDLYSRLRDLQPFIRPQPTPAVSSQDSQPFARILGDLKKDSKLEVPATRPATAGSALPSVKATSNLSESGFEKVGSDAAAIKRLPQHEAVKGLTDVPKAPEIVAARRVLTLEANASSPAPQQLGSDTPRNIGGKPLAREEVQPLVDRFATQHGVDPLLSLAVAYVESSFRPAVVSPDRHQSKGLFQLLDRTGQELLEQSGKSRGYDPFDPELNADLGIRHLRDLHDLFAEASGLSNGKNTVAAANSSSLEKLAVAAFNAGQGRVAAAQERAALLGKDPSDYDQIREQLPKTTQEYVDKVLAAKSTLGSSTGRG